MWVHFQIGHISICFRMAHLYIRQSLQQDASIFTAGHFLRSVHGLISFESFVISDDLHKHSSIQFMCYTIDFYKVCRPSLACVFSRIIAISVFV